MSLQGYVAKQRKARLVRTVAGVAEIVTGLPGLQGLAGIIAPEASARDLFRVGSKTFTKKRAAAPPRERIRGFSGGRGRRERD